MAILSLIAEYDDICSKKKTLLIEKKMSDKHPKLSKMRYFRIWGTSDVLKFCEIFAKLTIFIV